MNWLELESMWSSNHLKAFLISKFFITHQLFYRRLHFLFWKSIKHSISLIFSVLRNCYYNHVPKCLAEMSKKLQFTLEDMGALNWWTCLMKACVMNRLVLVDLFQKVNRVWLVTPSNCLLACCKLWAGKFKCFEIP